MSALVNGGSVLLRPAGPDDAEVLHALNQANLPHVGDISLEQVENFIRDCRVMVAVMADEDKKGDGADAPSGPSAASTASAGSGLLGFLVCMDQDADYESPNFLWFRERYDSFAYVDRVAVADTARRLGVGTRLYADAAGWARQRARLLTCEVNLRPPNPGSLAFHQRLGFHRVGVQDTCGGEKTVALMAKDLA